MNHEAPAPQKNDYVKLSSQMRKNHSFYKKAFSNYTDFVGVIENAIETARKRSQRGVDVTDASKDDSDEEMDNIALHTTNGEASDDDEAKLLQRDIAHMQKRGIAMEAVSSKNLLNDRLQQQYKGVLTSPEEAPKKKKSKLAEPQGMFLLTRINFQMVKLPHEVSNEHVKKKLLMNHNNKH
jgi:hypothetical protein